MDEALDLDGRLITRLISAKARPDHRAPAPGKAPRKSHPFGQPITFTGIGVTALAAEGETAVMATPLGRSPRRPLPQSLGREDPDPPQPTNQNMSRLETVAVGLEPDVLDLIDALRRTSPDLPSRSAIIRQMVHVAIAVMTDDGAVDALAEHHAGMAKMAAATPETAPEPAWTGSVKLREPSRL